MYLSYIMHSLCILNETASHQYCLEFTLHLQLASSLLFSLLCAWIPNTWCLRNSMSQWGTSEGHEVAVLLWKEPKLYKSCSVTPLCILMSAPLWVIPWYCQFLHAGWPSCTRDAQVSRLSISFTRVEEEENIKGNSLCFWLTLSESH